MNTLRLTRPTAFGFGIAARLSAFAASFSTWNDARATQKSLGKLSDRQLEDIGLTRGNIGLITR